MDDTTVKLGTTRQTALILSLCERRARPMSDYCTYDVLSDALIATGVALKEEEGLRWSCSIPDASRIIAYLC